jgi:hypothetical protein
MLYYKSRAKTSLPLFFHFFLNVYDWQKTSLCAWNVFSPSVGSDLMTQSLLVVLRCA